MDLERKLKHLDTSQIGRPSNAVVFSTQSDVNFALFGNSGPQARTGALAARMSQTIEDRILANSIYEVDREHT